MGFEPSITLAHHPRSGSDLGLERLGVVRWNLCDDCPVKCLNDLKLL
jgi:hypothetical protein